MYHTGTVFVDETYNVHMELLYGITYSACTFVMYWSVLVGQNFVHQLCQHLCVKHY